MKYQDSRGWTYEVKQGIGLPPAYKARADRQGGGRSRFVGVLPWRETREEAEVDLKHWAQKRKMALVEEREGNGRQEDG